MAGFVTPGGERFAIFGEGGGQALADELDVPLLGKVPLTMPLREQADAGVPLVVTDPDDPAAQAIRQAARGLVAMFPARAADPADGDRRRLRRRPGERRPAGISLPMAGLAGEGPLHGRGDRHRRALTPAAAGPPTAPSTSCAPRPSSAGRAAGRTPEQLFAVGYAACFEGAEDVAPPREARGRRREHPSKVSLGPGEDKASRSRSRST